MEFCLDIMSAGPNVQAADEWLCTLIRLQQIVDDSSQLLGPIDPRVAEAFDDPSTQYKLKMLERRLESWRKSAPGAVDDRGFFAKFVTRTSNLVANSMTRSKDNCSAFRRPVSSSPCSSKLPL